MTETSVQLSNEQQALYACIGELRDARSKAKKATKEVDDCYKDLLELPAVQDAIKKKAKGATKINSVLTVTAKVTETFDQEKLDEIRYGIDMEMNETGVKPVPEHLFPFKQVWKLDQKLLDSLKTLHPDLHAYIMTAMTSKPAKSELKISE